METGAYMLFRRAVRTRSFHRWCEVPSPGPTSSCRLVRSMMPTKGSFILNGSAIEAPYRALHRLLVDSETVGQNMCFAPKTIGFDPCPNWNA